MAAAVILIIIGLYAIAFNRSAAEWAIGVDGRMAGSQVDKGVYLFSFRLVGAFMIAFGALMVLLIV